MMVCKVTAHGIMPIMISTVISSCTIFPYITCFRFSFFAADTLRVKHWQTSNPNTEIHDLMTLHDNENDTNIGPGMLDRFLNLS